MRRRVATMMVVLTVLVLTAPKAVIAADSTVVVDRDVLDGYTSLALNPAGNPVIAYVSLANNRLNIAHCTKPNCRGPKSITSPTSDIARYEVSLVLDGAGNPVVSYYDETNGDLKILHCNDPNCIGGDESVTSADGAGRDVGRHSSLVLDGAGNPVVSYYDATENDLKVMHCNDANCAGGDESITSPDTLGNVGQYTSLRLDSSGYPVVSYYDLNNGVVVTEDLNILHCNDANCAGGDESITSPDTIGDVGQYTSLRLDSSGYPVVSYFDDTNFDLKIMHCNDANCAGGDESVTSPDTGGNVGKYNSLRLDGSGNPVVSYFDHTNFDLKIMHCNDANCAGGDESVTSPDARVLGGQFTSLALDGGGNPVVSYWDNANSRLKLLYCDDPNCS